MKDTIFEFDDYKKYLLKRIRQEPLAGHGFRKKMAQAMNSQGAYLSQVLNGDRHISADQTILLAEFLGLNDSESAYFLNLVEFARAGTPKSRAYFKKTLHDLRGKSVETKLRGTQNSKELSEVDSGIFCGDIAYSAVHLAVGIEGLQTFSALAERLRLRPEHLRRILDFLIKKGLVISKGGKFLQGEAFLHISRETPYISGHHRNWRAKALESSMERRESDLHATIAFTINEADAARIRQKIADVLAEASTIAQGSTEEKIVGLCVDFFEYY
jgi:uncharacterized protein (TIGR02147 family)